MTRATASTFMPTQALLASLIGCTSAPAQDVLQLACQAAAGNGRPIVLLVVPPASPAAADPDGARALRQTFVERLRTLQRGGEIDGDRLAQILPFGNARERAIARIQTMMLARDPELIRLWLDANVAVVERSEVPGFDPDHPDNMLLLDRDGMRRESATVDWSDEASVARATRQLLDADERRHDRRKTSSDLARTFQELVDPARKHTGPPTEIDATLAKIAYRYPEFAPWIHGELGTATGAYRENLARIMDLAQRAFRSPGDPLPFGVTWATADPRPEPAPCPACGMAIRITDLARRIVLDR